jgi:hypothetical protein
MMVQKHRGPRAYGAPPEQAACGRCRYGVLCNFSNGTRFVPWYSTLWLVFIRKVTTVLLIRSNKELNPT